VTDKAIRVQLPGGDLYAPAIHKAAAKTAARSDLPKKAIASLNSMVTASVALLNSGSATMISLEMLVHEDTVTVTLVGKGCASPSKKMATTLRKLGAKKTRSFDHSTTKSACTIHFEI